MTKSNRRQPLGSLTLLLLAFALIGCFKRVSCLGLNFKKVIDAATNEYIVSKEWVDFKSSFGYFFPIPTCSGPFEYPTHFDWTSKEMILCYELDVVYPWDLIHEKAGQLLVKTIKNHYKISELNPKFYLVNTTEKGFFPSLKYAVDSGACDVAIASTNIDPIRSTHVEFQCSYGTSYDGLLRSCLDNNTLIISTPSDLNKEGVLVAAPKTTSSYIWAKANLPKATLLSDLGYGDAYNLVRSQQVHAMIGDSTELNMWLDRNRGNCSSCFVKIVGDANNFGSFISKLIAMPSSGEQSSSSQYYSLSSSSSSSLGISKQTFWSLVNTSSKTLNISLYWGEGNTANGSPICGLSIEKPCSKYSQLYYSLNSTLYDQYFEFLNMTSVVRSIVVKINILGAGTNKQLICATEWNFFPQFQLLSFFVEISNVAGPGHSAGLKCLHDSVNSNFILVKDAVAIYLHDLVMVDFNVLFQSQSIMIENCVLSGSRILDYDVDKDIPSQNFIFENSHSNEIFSVRNRKSVLLFDSTLELNLVFTSCESIFISGCSLRTFINIEGSNIVNVQNSTIAMIHTLSCKNVSVMDCETSDLNQKTKELQKNSGLISVLSQSGTRFFLKNVRVFRGVYLASIVSFETAIIENITMIDGGKLEQENTLLVDFREVLSIAIYNLILDERFGHIFAKHHSAITVLNCEFSQQKKHLHLDEAMVLQSMRSYVNLVNSKFSNALNSSVYIRSANRLHISGCEFYNNVSPYYGGAVNVVWLEVESVITNSKFINNRVQCQQGDTTLSPTTLNPELCGGGAISINSLSSVMMAYRLDFFSNQFIGNYAERGGAIFVGYHPNYAFRLPSNLFANNTGRLSGGAMYIHRSTLPTIENLYESTFIGNVEGIGNAVTCALELSSASFESVPIMDEIHELTIGELYNISFVTKTVGGIVTPFSDQMLQVTSPLSFVKFEMVQYLTNLSFKLIIFGNSSLSTTIFDTKSIITVSNGFQNLTFPFRIGQCKPGTELYQSLTPDSTLFNYGCKKVQEFPIETVVGIAVGSSLVLFIFGIAIGLIMYCVVTTMKKLNRLKRKERAEQAIENKLLDKSLIFQWTEEEEQEYHNKTSSSGEKESSKQHSNKYESIKSSNADTELSHSLIRSERHSSKKDESFIIPIEKIKIEKRIGEGGSANVFLGSWSNIKVAIKSLKYNGGIEDGDDEEFEKEAAVLSRMRHPNVLIFYGVCLTEKSKYIVTEYMESGSLDRFIAHSKYSNFTNQHFLSVLKILIDIVNGMIYLHSLKPAIIHRDLKPGNVLLNEKNLAKVSDFGLVKIMGNTIQTQMTKQIGTILYCSPETFLQDIQIENKEATKIDVYSFAIIMWEMFFRKSPFQNVNNTFQIPSMVISGQRPTIPFDISDNGQIHQWLASNTQLLIDSEMIECVKVFLELITNCWHQNPSHRPTFASIYESLNQIIEKLN